jgi:hypothetical protein
VGNADPMGDPESAGASRSGHAAPASGLEPRGPAGCWPRAGAPHGLRALRAGDREIVTAEAVLLGEMPEAGRSAEDVRAMRSGLRDAPPRAELREDALHTLYVRGPATRDREVRAALVPEHVRPEEARAEVLLAGVRRAEPFGRPPSALDGDRGQAHGTRRSANAIVVQPINSIINERRRRRYPSPSFSAYAPILVICRNAFTHRSH